MKLTGEPKLKVKILSPTRVHYDGPALGLSAINKMGPFDILADHANFFSMLTKGNVTVHVPGNRFVIPISQGIVKVKDNLVTLFVDIEQVKVSSPSQRSARTQARQ